MQSNYGSSEQQKPAAAVEMVSQKSKAPNKIKGLLDEVELNTLLLSIVVCFFVTFGVKATQAAKENAIKNFVVLVGGITFFGLMIVTGNIKLSIFSLVIQRGPVQTDWFFI